MLVVWQRKPDEKGFLKRRRKDSLEKDFKDISYVGEISRIWKMIRKRRLNPLDNVIDSTTQYVSGMAEQRSHRIGLDNNRR